jgi:hypothetical protein
VNFYLDLSRATTRAADTTRGVRRATAILDRVVRDLESTVLVKNPAGQDPLSHPWIFLGQSGLAEDGSDRLKFVIRGHEPRSPDSRESDLAVVVYSVRRQEDDEEKLELRRWTSPQLPERLDRDFPPDEETQLLAEGLVSFSARFLAEDGEWKRDWDSSQLAESGALPQAVEVALALAPEGAAAPGAGAADPGELPQFRRIAVLPLRPLDLEALLEPRAAGAGGEPGAGEDQPGASGEHAGEGAGAGGGQASAEGSDEAGALTAQDLRPGATVGDCVIRVPTSAEVPFVQPSWEAFVRQNELRPLAEFIQLFPPESIDPGCLL